MSQPPFKGRYLIVANVKNFPYFFEYKRHEKWTKKHAETNIDVAR